MRILVVGAGALGGYFGGRPARGRQGRHASCCGRDGRRSWRQTGLVVRSPKGDLTLPAPPSVQADGIEGPFDLVVVGCKAYDLAQTMDSFAPAVGPETAILPC